MYMHIFLNFGVISFINKEMVCLFQLHTYKFGLVYIYRQIDAMVMKKVKIYIKISFTSRPISNQNFIMT